MEFVDIHAIAKSVSNANIFKWEQEVLAKITKECEECGVKVLGKASNTTMKTKTIVNNSGVKFLKLTERAIK